MARSKEGKRKRRSDMSSSDEESEEESSKEEASSKEEKKERGKKPAPAANAAESVQQKLDRSWVNTANAWDCNRRLEWELEQAKNHTNSLVSQLRQENARQESLKKLIETKKKQNDQDERAKCATETARDRRCEDQKC